MLFHSILCIPSVLPKNSFTYNVKIGTFRNPKFAFLIKVLITVVIVPTSLHRYNVIPLHSYTGIPLYRCTIIPLLPLKNVKSPLMPLAFVLSAFVFHRIQVYLNGIRRASETKLGCLFRDCVYFVIQSCTLWFTFWNSAENFWCGYMTSMSCQRYSNSHPIVDAMLRLLCTLLLRIIQLWDNHRVSRARQRRTPRNFLLPADFMHRITQTIFSFRCNNPSWSRRMSRIVRWYDLVKNLWNGAGTEKRLYPAALPGRSHSGTTQHTFSKARKRVPTDTPQTQ